MAPRVAQDVLDHESVIEIGTGKRAVAGTVPGAETVNTGSVAVIVIDTMKNATGTVTENETGKEKESTGGTEEKRTKGTSR